MEEAERTPYILCLPHSQNRGKQHDPSRGPHRFSHTKVTNLNNHTKARLIFISSRVVFVGSSGGNAAEKEKRSLYFARNQSLFVDLLITQSLHGMIKDIDKQIAAWHENNEPAKIIELLESLPQPALTRERMGWLARAYNNLAGEEDKPEYYETAIREFMSSSTKRDLIIICNHEGNAYFEELRSKTQFDKDPRVKFVGTVYDQDLLKYIRKEAFAYIHGHEVGGTNPGLLEAMAQTDLNLVLGVSFNRSVAQDTARYWKKDEGNLSHLIDQVDGVLDYSELGKLAKENMEQNFTWKKIVGEYEELFLS